MSDSTAPTILIIIGVTGDLSRRKLLPAIEQLAQAGVLPDKFHLLGISRRQVSAADVLAGSTQDAARQFVAPHLETYQMDLTSLADYEQLARHLSDIERTLGGEAQRLFYLSVPPQISQPIIQLLGESGLSKLPGTKLLLEKPFGTDRLSAEALTAETTACFAEAQLYRIDHYLAKEMSQNLIVFRASNLLFQRTWDKQFIEKIEIIASEQIGIEGRTTFYEQTGALRDFVQSHLLQLAALALMDVPPAGQLAMVPERRLHALRQLHLDNNVPAVRGQYEGYRDEVGNPNSTVETFVQLQLTSDDPRWSGVPITLTTGKALDRKTTEIRLTYKKDAGYESNELIIRLQPDEGIELCVWAKTPGYAWRVDKHSLKLAFRGDFSAVPEPYEQVLLDAINSNHALFATSDEVLETWRILAPVQQAWEMANDNGLIRYRSGETAADITARA